MYGVKQEENKGRDNEIIVLQSNIQHNPVRGEERKR